METWIKDALVWRRQRRWQNTLGWRQWVAEKLFNAAGAPPRRLSGSSGAFDSAAGALAAASRCKREAVSLGESRAEWGKIGPPPQRGEHHSQPAASMQRDNFPLPALALSLANAVCVARCIAHARQMTGTKQDGDVFIPHSPSRSWGRRQALWAARGLEPVWLLPSSGRVS